MQVPNSFINIPKIDITILENIGGIYIKRNLSFILSVLTVMMMVQFVHLTGHGSEVDKETCMKLGAYAYLQKPVDIDLLSKTLKKANEKIQQKKQK